jgi:outer membrane immunogenic protein
MRWGAVIGGVTLAFLPSLSARAADMTPIAQRATSGYIPAQFYWSGFYLGAALGDAWGTSTFTDLIAVPPQIGTPSLNGILFGGLVGLNYQFGSWVIGIEGDVMGTWANGSVNDAAGNNLQTKVFSTASLTGRLGFAFDRLLIYGKGGGALDYDRDFITVGGVETIGTTNHLGWTVGGGLDYAFTEHWIARFEYDYFKFSSKSLFFSGGTRTGGGGIVGLTLNEAKAAIAYKF